MMNCRMHILCVVVVGLSGTVFAEEPSSSDVWKDLIGKRAPLCVVTPATGCWAERHPFDPAKYGLTRGFSPGGRPGIMIYARSLPPRVLDIAARVDAIVADRAGLKLSCLHLFDPKGAQHGGYTADEVSARISELQKIAGERNLKHLSIGIAANGSDGHAAKVGIDSSHDVVIAVMAENPEPKKHAVVSWYRAVASAGLSDAELEELAASLQTAAAH